MDLTVEPWGEGRVVTVHPRPCDPVDRTVPGDPSAAAFFVVAGCVVPGSVVDVREVYQGPGPPGLRLGPPAHGGQVTVTRRRPDGTGHTTAITAQAGPLARHRRWPRPRSPPSTRSPPWPWPPPWPRGPRSSTDVGELRVKEVDRLAAVVDMVRAFGATAQAERRHAVDHRGRSRRTPARRPLRQPGRSPHGHGRRRGRPGRRPGERSLITGFDAVETSYPAFAEDLRT